MNVMLIKHQYLKGETGLNVQNNVLLYDNEQPNDDR